MGVLHFMMLFRHKLIYVCMLGEVLPADDRYDGGGGASGSHGSGRIH